LPIRREQRCDSVNSELTSDTTGNEAAAVSFDISIVNTHAQFKMLQPDWDDLARRQKNPLLTFDWFDCCRQAFDLEPHVVTILRNDRVVAVAPLARRRSHLGKRLIFLDEMLWEYHELLYKDGAALEALCSALAELRLPAILSRIRIESPEHVALAQAFAARHTPFLVTSPNRFSWITIAGSAAANARRLRKRQRVSSALGPVQLVNVSVTSDTVAYYRDAFLRVEAAGWKGRSGSAVAHNPDLLRFWTAFLERAALSGQLEIGIGRVGDAIAAMRLLLVYGDRQWEIKIGYDEAYASASPGTLVLLSQLVDGAEHGRVAHVFLGTAEAWQDRFAPVHVQFETIRTFPWCFWSAAAFLNDAGPVLMKRARSLLRGRHQESGEAPSA
jgi:CelD/BcsL family acetyltransferase involved in cellulose biosynthesis